MQDRSQVNCIQRSRAGCVTRLRRD